jgi:V8-like Glu-specific endopeptidase
MWSQWLTNLNEVLADLFPTVDESRTVVTMAGMRAGLIPFNNASLVNWNGILKQAALQSPDPRADQPQLARNILAIALESYPANPLLLALARDEPPAVKGTDIRKDVQWETPVSDEHLERITGTRSTLLPIRFLEMGFVKSRAVARVVRSNGTSGTGFLIGGGWLLTNNHVLPSPELAAGSRAEFNYQQTLDGADEPITPYPLDPTRFHTSKEDDWTVIGIDAAAATRWGALPLEPVTIEVDAFVNIIQHPGGGPKQIALYHNTVAFAGHGRLQYLTDTLPGSSGSPVFDDQWRVVALHHSGGMLREPGTKKSFYRNEGILVGTVLEGIAAAGVTLQT